MAHKPVGLSPCYSSLVSPDIEDTLEFSWTFISSGKDKQKSAVVRIYEQGSSTTLTSVSTGVSESVLVTDRLSSLVLGKIYEWTVTVTSTDGTSATSNRQKFRYSSITESPLEWPDGPEPYEYIGTEYVGSRAYFTEIRDNAVLVLNSYVTSSKSDQALLKKAKALFTGDVVPSRDDFLAVEEVIHYIATKEEEAKNQVDELILDGLGASDIHKIYGFFNKLAKSSPDSSPSATLSFSNIVPLAMTSGKASNNGEADLTIDVSWASNSIQQATCTMAIGPDPGVNISYYRIIFASGYNDFVVNQTLYYRRQDIASMGRKIVVPCEHPNYHHLSKTKKARYRIDIRATTTRLANSSSYGITYSPTTIPIGVSKYQLRAQRRDLSNKTVIKDYYDIYNGTNKAYTHKVAETATGTYRYAVRVYDVNGQISSWLYISNYIKIDPLKPPAAPKPTISDKTVDSLTVKWAAVAKADSYEIQPQYGSKATYGLTGLSKKFTGLKDATSYSYKVRAKNRAGYSAWVTVTGKTNTKPTVSKVETKAKSRCWRTSYKILYQSGGSSSPSAEYRPKYDNKEVFHGQWIELVNKVQDGLRVKKGTRWGNHKSLFFLDYSYWQKTLKGKEIKSVRFYIKRKSSQHGYPYDGRFLHVYTHNYTGPSALPSASKGPTISNHKKIENLDWNRGEGHWVNLPVSWGEMLRDGKIKGIAFHHPTSEQSPYSYMRFDATSFKFEVKYK